ELLVGHLVPAPPVNDRVQLEEGERQTLRDRAAGSGLPGAARADDREPRAQRAPDRCVYTVRHAARAAMAALRAGADRRPGGAGKGASRAVAAGPEASCRRRVRLLSARR